MKLIVDSQALIWFIVNNPRLTATARDAMEDPRNELVTSPATIWEMAVKISIGKLLLPIPFPEFMRRGIETYGIKLDPITPAHAEIVSLLPFHHNDPFDRMIAAQATASRTPVISSDAIFEKYGVTRIW